MTDKVEKTKTPKAPASHPAYIEMVSSAIKDVGGRNGASRQAILKYVCNSYKVDNIFMYLMFIFLILMDILGVVVYFTYFV